MTNARPKSIPKEAWDKAAEAYELGTKHGTAIARELGVSPATVSREFKRRGCRKGCRAFETVVALNAALDERDRERMRRRDEELAATARRSASLDSLVDGMMKALLAADEGGNLSAAAPVVAEVDRALRA
jgi:DNA-binding MurR/RpiR family transcriptional regulator